MRNPHHILITGASSGIGAALALAYAEPGVVLSLHGRNSERLEAVARQARLSGAEVSTHRGDVADETGMAEWIMGRDEAEPLDLVIANAGISAGTAPVAQMAKQRRQIFDVNVGGVFNTIDPILPAMTSRKRGQIAIVSSLAGFRGFAGSSAYGASKAAIKVYGEALRAEMAPQGVEVNVVCPGFIKTPMTDVNNFWMPFLMGPKEAARIIRKGLKANRARIAFPFGMYLLVRFLCALPQPLMDALVVYMPRKMQSP